MKTELKVIESNGKYVVDSRNVAEMVKKEHSHLLRDIKIYMEVLGESNFGLADFFIESSYFDTQGKTRPCYLLTKKGCDMVANKMIGEKGILFTATYVTKFEAMEKQLKNNNLPSNYLEALKALVATEEEKLKLEADNLAKQALIEEMKPKVNFADKLLKSKDNILVREYSKILQDEGFNLGEKKLYKWLRNNEFLMQNNEPYQRYMKYFVVIENTIDTPFGEKITKTTKVRPEGQLYFYEKLKEEFTI